jgi:hypothetical protein
MTRFGLSERRLVCLRSLHLVARDHGCGSDDLLDCLVQGDFAAIVREASEWVEYIIEDILDSPDNPYADSEEVAAEILKRLKL